MSKPSKAALEEAVPTTVWHDRLGRLLARRRGKPVPVPQEVQDLVDDGHGLHTIWSRLDCFGGGVKACPWLLTGRGPNGEQA